MSLFQRFTVNGHTTPRSPAWRPPAPPTPSSDAPHTIWHEGRIITYAGTGGAAGSHIYRDGVQSLELYECQVTHTGPYYAQVAVPNNWNLQRVRIPNVIDGRHSVQFGDRLLIGPIEYATTGPQASAAWRLWSRGPERRRGTIVDVRGAYGFIRDAQSGLSVFVHRNQMRPTVPLIVGQQVSFVLWQNDRGPTATDVL